jgi:ribosomal protein L11 methyltransferase
MAFTLTLTAPNGSEGAFQEVLEALSGAVAADLENAGDAAGAGPARWRITAYFAERPDAAAIATLVAETAAALGIAAPAFAVAALVERDWQAEAAARAPAVRAGRFLVHRGQADAPAPGGPVGIEIEAGLAFGTGAHASTVGCLLAIDALARGRRVRRVLDLGTGTGILAIAALKAWPCRATATDIDPVAVRVARANAARNGVGARMHAAVGPGPRALAGRAGRFDLVLANILVRPLAAMAPALVRRVAPGGLVVLSGLLAADENEALAAYRAHGFALAARVAAGHWVTLLLGRRRPRALAAPHSRD